MLKTPVFDTFNLPYRNIRDVLSLHAKTARKKTFLISMDENNEKDTLSYYEFNARVHQVANFLFEDLQLKRGDRIAMMSGNSSDTTLLMVAGWVVGVSIVPIQPKHDDATIAVLLRESQATVGFIQNTYVERIESILPTASNIQGIVQIGGEPNDDYLHFHEVIRNRPITFLGDDSGAKADDLSILAGNELTPILSDEAILFYPLSTQSGVKSITLTQAQLIKNAQAVANALAFTGNQRIMTTSSLLEVSGFMMSLLVPLFVGGSSVLNAEFSAEQFWQQIVVEKIHVVNVTPTILHTLVDYGHSQEKQGNTIFGHNITRRNLSFFRNFVCSGGTVSTQLAHEFEELFGFPLIQGFSVDEVAGYVTLLPVNLAWNERQQWLFGNEHSSIGVPIVGYQMAIFSDRGTELREQEHGEICIQVLASPETVNSGEEWIQTGKYGYYLLDGFDRKFFFVS